MGTAQNRILNRFPERFSTVTIEKLSDFNADLIARLKQLSATCSSEVLQQARIYVG